MKQITETLWLDRYQELAIVQPESRTDWVVFGPNNFGNCRQYIEKRKQDVS